MTPYPHRVLALKSLDPVIRVALARYVAGLWRRTRMPWGIERIAKPGRYYRAVLVNPDGARVPLHYYEGKNTRARWRADHTRRFFAKVEPEELVNRERCPQ